MINILKGMALAFALSFLSIANAATLTNSNGGDGYVVEFDLPYYFTLYGADNGVDNNIATYAITMASDFTGDLGWKYVSHDSDGASYDPAGYFINDTYYQLSPADSTTGQVFYGVISLALSAGDVFGGYVDSTDGVEGRGVISFGPVSAIPAVPEPATWALMIVGFGTAGAMLRRRREENRRFAVAA